MDKKKFSEELRKKGYDATVEGGVVMVKKPGKIEDTIKEIKALAESLDYHQSIGVRAVAESKAAPKIVAENPEEDADTITEGENEIEVGEDADKAVDESGDKFVDKSGDKSSDKAVETGEATKNDDDFFDEEDIDESGDLDSFGSNSFEQMNLLDMFN